MRGRIAIEKECSITKKNTYSIYAHIHTSSGGKCEREKSRGEENSPAYLCELSLHQSGNLHFRHHDGIFHEHMFLLATLHLKGERANIQQREVQRERQGDESEKNKTLLDELGSRGEGG
jgi:hypothetical protein